jgi:hypothetical protein
VTSDVARASRAGLSAEGTAASQRVLIGGVRRNPATVVVLAGQSNERVLAALGSSLNVVLVRPESPPDAARAAEGAAAQVGSECPSPRISASLGSEPLGPIHGPDAVDLRACPDFSMTVDSVNEDRAELTRWSQGRLPWLAASGLLAACLVDGLAEAGDFQDAGAHEPSPASSGFHQLGPLGYLADFQVGLTQVAPHELGQVVPGSY